MDTPGWAVRQGHRLVQIGAAVFLVALVIGILIPTFTVPRLGLATHLLGITQGIFLMVLGVLWSRLRLSHAMSSVGVFLAVYGCLAAWAANLSGAIVGAGNTLLPMAAGPAHGTALQETVIALLLRSSGVSLIAATLVVLWGLRLQTSE